MRQIILNRIYRHFKGGLYRTLYFAKHTETGEELVVYQSIETQEVFARPKAMFASKVDKKKYPNVTQKFRLELVNDKDIYCEHYKKIEGTICLRKADNDSFISEYINALPLAELYVYKNYVSCVYIDKFYGNCIPTTLVTDVSDLSQFINKLNKRMLRM